MAKETPATTEQQSVTEYRSGYLEVLGNKAEIKELMAANIGADKLDAFSLTRIKIPTGGATGWTVPTLTGDEITKTINGIIVAWQPWRVFWPSREPQPGTPPQCSSRNGVTGIGNPGGECEPCFFNQWDSAPDGRAGKGCKEVRALFFLEEGKLFPHLVVASVMSVEPMRQYFLQLANNGRLLYWKVVTTLELQKASNRDGIAYAKIAPKFLRVLDAEEIDAVQSYRESISALLEHAQMPMAGEVAGQPFEG